jgi:hypothetical protein
MDMSKVGLAAVAAFVVAIPLVNVIFPRDNSPAGQLAEARKYVAEWQQVIAEDEAKIAALQPNIPGANT